MTTEQRSWSDSGPGEWPVVRQVVLDCPDPRLLAEFYRQLLGYHYRPGDEPPPAGAADPRGGDWLVLRPLPDDPLGARGIAFQRVDDYRPPVWSPQAAAAESTRAAGQHQMLHLDMTVPDTQALTRQRDRALELGATVLHDRSHDAEEPLYVLADPIGHPFCIFVG
jgi:hypothetical protein